MDRGQVFHQKLRGAFDQSDPDLAPTQALEVVDLRSRFAEVAAEAADGLQKDLAGGCQPKPLRHALEQGQAQLLLQLDDLPVHRGGRDVEVFGGATDRPAPSHLIEIDRRSAENHPFTMPDPFSFSITRPEIWIWNYSCPFRSTSTSDSLREADRLMGFENGFPTRAAHGASLLVLAATLTVAGAASAQAQAAAPAAQTQAGAPTGQTQAAAPALEEIVVTAEHVTENAQTTPITMSVYSGKSLKSLDVTSINSLSTIAPDLNFSVAEGEPVLTVRGISSRDVTENGDPAVTVDTDGFYLNRSYALDATLYDLDRVELLRGPQGTLNGRNSVGGSLNVVTAKPTDDFGAYTSLEYGSYNELNFQGMVNIPCITQIHVQHFHYVVH